MIYNKLHKQQMSDWEDFEDHCCDDKKNRYSSNKKSSFLTHKQNTNQYHFDKRDNYNLYDDQQLIKSYPT